jgi:hypothetical protein
MVDTPRLKLPLMDAAQAQKHVTHNEALLQLDLLTGVIPVVSRSLSAPPAALDGAVYILAGTGTGAWTGFSANDLALRIDGRWRRVIPSVGMVAAVVGEGGAQIHWTGSIWAALGGSRGLASKAVSTSRTNTTVLANDPDLQFQMAANTNYAITLKLYFSAPAAPGFKYAMTGPASAIRVQAEQRLRAPGATAETVGGGLIYPASTIVAGNFLDYGFLFAELVVENGANAGAFALQWAQGLVDASASILRAGSTLEWLRLGANDGAGVPAGYAAMSLGSTPSNATTIRVGSAAASDRIIFKTGA